MSTIKVREELIEECPSAVCRMRKESEEESQENDTLNKGMFVSK